MEEYENGQKTEDETHLIESERAPGSYILEPENETLEENDDTAVTTELAVGNDVQSDVDERSNGDSALVETEENMVLASTNGNPEVLSNIGSDNVLVSGENVPIEKNYVEESVQVNKDYIEDNPSTPTDAENREINQSPISANPTLERRTSWAGCCGLFQVLRRSND